MDIQILSIRNSDASFSSSFSEAGINQTLQQLNMQVSVDVTILILGQTTSFTISSQVVVAETIIVGDVPDTENTYIIDTPGIKGFNTFDMQVEEVGHYFPEIFKASQHCRYGNCSHRHEPGCAVQEALAQHLISESRYHSYLNILEDAHTGKYRDAD